VQENSALLRASKDIGRKDTAKDKLRRTLNEERAGIKITQSDIPLVIERDISSDDEGDDDEGDDNPAMEVDLSMMARPLAKPGGPALGRQQPTTPAVPESSKKRKRPAKKNKTPGDGQPTSGNVEIPPRIPTNLPRSHSLFLSLPFDLAFHFGL